jgi:hypothetical protein
MVPWISRWLTMSTLRGRERLMLAGLGKDDLILSSQADRNKRSRCLCDCRSTPDTERGAWSPRPGRPRAVPPYCAACGVPKRGIGC